ncbi:MAG: choice-of-anchor V domain-containing protein [Myxococcaceae bacterium]
MQSLIVFSSLSAPVAFANADGRATASFDGTGPVNCEFCHKGGAGTANATFVAPTTGVTTGAAATFQLTITGGPAKNGGATIAATDGTLAPVSPSLVVEGGKLVHNGGINFPGATLTLEFTLTPTGAVPKLSAAVASANADTGEGGDVGATTKMDVMLGGGGGGGDGEGGGSKEPDIVGYMNFGCDTALGAPGVCAFFSLAGLCLSRRKH